MATNVGRVGIVMKGTWSSSATYEGLDAVTYNGALYIAKQDVPANTLPTNATYWQAALELTTQIYSLTDVKLEYSSSGATNPTFTINGTSGMARRGNTVTFFIWFMISDKGSGNGLRVTGLPFIPIIGRSLCQLGGSAIGAPSDGVIDANSGSIILHRPDGGDVNGGNINAGNLWVGCTVSVV